MKGSWPNFIIPGAGKSGTSSIAYYLSQHPDVFVSTPKEPTFFSYAECPPIFNSPDAFHEQIIASKDAYLKLFSEASGHSAVGEASTYYLALAEQTIENIRRLVPEYVDIRIPIILRNPVDRAFSNYCMFLMYGWDDETFERAISSEVVSKRMSAGWSPSYDYLSEGMYYAKVKAYCDTFRQVRVYLYDDLEKDPAGLMRNLFEFLGVDPTFEPDVAQRLNSSGLLRSQVLHTLLHTENRLRTIVRHVLRLALPARRRAMLKQIIDRSNKRRLELSPTARAYLTDIYRDDITKLMSLIGRDLTHWLEMPAQVMPH